jgi:hypothetical protein
MRQFYSNFHGLLLTGLWKVPLDKSHPSLAKAVRKNWWTEKVVRKNYIGLLL